MSMIGKGSVDSGGVGPEGSLTVDGWRCCRVAVSDDFLYWMLGDDDGRRKAWHCWMEEDSRRSFVVDCIMILLCFRHVMVDVWSLVFGMERK